MTTIRERAETLIYNLKFICINRDEIAIKALKVERKLVVDRVKTFIDETEPDAIEIVEFLDKLVEV